MNIIKPNSSSQILTAIMPWRGIDVENTAIVSEEIISSEHFTSIEIKKLIVTINPNEKLSNKFYDPEINTSLKDCIIKVGQEVNYGDILVSKGIHNSSENSPEELLLKAIFGENHLENSSINMPFRDKAIVVNVEMVKKKQIFIYLAIKHKLKVGDVLTDVNGNEVVVAKIVSSDEMPIIRNYYPDNQTKKVLMVITPPTSFSELSMSKIQNYPTLYFPELLPCSHVLKKPFFIIYSKNDFKNITLTRSNSCKKETRNSSYSDETAKVGEIYFTKIE